MTLTEPSLAIDAMRLSANQVSRLLRVLANKDRLLLLSQLSQGECSVGELETKLGIYQPTLSQQLAVLRAEGLVQTRRESQRIYYSAAAPKALVLLKTLYALYCPA